MTQEEMNVLVPAKLRELEASEGIRVLFAVESGSRAWGFASPDSDFDVRFIYVRPAEFYLRLEKTRDVIEMPIDDTWDVSGWDLQKALRLLHNSNPSLFEWAASPIVYHSEPAWEERIAPILSEYYRPLKNLWHYLSMARRNSIAFYEREMVKLKRYFYILRPILAAKWVLTRGCPPPVLFDALVQDQLPSEHAATVEVLLRRKRSALEAEWISHIPALDLYMKQEQASLQSAAERMNDSAGRDWRALDRLFLEVIRDFFDRAL